MSYQITTPEYLTIDGVPTRTPAWKAMTHRPLLRPADQKGQDRQLPGPFTIANRRSTTVTTVQVPMMFMGSADWEGNPPVDGDPVGQVYENFWHFCRAVVDPTNVGDGTRDLVLHLPQRTLVGRAHVSGSGDPVSASDQLLRWTLVLSLPDGRLVDVDDVES